MSKGALLELAARVEAVTGPDRELDFAIYAVTCGGDCSHIRPNQRYLYGESYTASVDAALGLVPAGWAVRNFDDWTPETPPYWSVDLRRLDRAHHVAQGEAATPALALTAAALRARSGGGDAPNQGKEG